MAQKGFSIGAPHSLVGSGVNTGFFFEACNPSFEHAQRFLHGILLTLVFGLQGGKPSFHLRLHGVKAPVNLVKHGQHCHEQTHQ